MPFRNTVDYIQKQVRLSYNVYIFTRYKFSDGGNLTKMSILKLKLNIAPAYIGPILSLADAWSAENALSNDVSSRFRMAVEEFASYLSSVFSGEELSAEFGEYGRRIFAEFSFNEKDIDLSALNMVNIHRKAGHEVSTDTSLMLARLSADNFTVCADAHGRLAIRAYIEKSYPCETPQQPCGASVPPLKLSANKDTLHAAMLTAAGIDGSFAESLYARSPEALAADIEAGAAKALWAEDGAGHPAAFIYWEERGRTAIFNGPYSAAADPDGKALTFVVEKFLSSAAKSGMTCAVSETAVPVAVAAYFEKYGDLYYRAMNEDCGGNVWAPQALIPEIDRIYDAFDLMRRVIPADFTPSAGKSLLDVSFSRDRRSAVIIPLMIHSDFSELLRAHTKKLSGMGFETITALFKLGSRSEASAAAAASECGYEPVWIRPGECLEDTLVMKYAK